MTGLCVDLLKPKLVHTCGDDKNVVTIDLDQARRVQCHSVKEGGFRSMVQATTGELELITADAAGNLKVVAAPRPLLPAHTRSRQTSVHI